MTWGSRRILVGAVACAGGLTAACGDLIVLAEEPTTQPTLGESTTCLFEDDGKKPNVELYTFWKEDPDEDARSYLEQRLNGLPGFILPKLLDNRAQLQALLAEVKVNPAFEIGPDDSPVDIVVQANGGSDVLRYTLPEAVTDVCGLESIFSELQVRERFFEAGWRASECQGVPLAVPLNIHRVNSVMVNTSLYEQLRALSAESEHPVPPFSELSSTDELLEVLEFAHSAGLLGPSGNPVVPLAVCLGNKPDDTWPLHHLAFEGVLASYGDRSYEAIWQGTGSLSRDEKEAVVTRLAAHLTRFGAVSHLGANYDALCGASSAALVQWQDAPRQVIAGEALMTVGGDWMRALAEARASDSVATYGYPSEVETFAYTPDSFTALSLAGSRGSSARRWFLDVVGKPEIQVAFAKLKEGIPARADIDPALLESDYLEQTYEQFGDCHDFGSACRLLLAVSGLGPANGIDPCADRIGMLLAAIAGAQSVAWEESDCDAWQVEGALDPVAKLTELLLEISETPFAQDCRVP